jgi:hypothetical protein
MSETKMMIKVFGSGRVEKYMYGSHKRKRAALMPCLGLETDADI